MTIYGIISKMVNENLSKYCGIMEEIKKRDLVIRELLSGRCTTLYKATNLESMCLQLRKILELIALSSMVMNQEQYKEFHANFDKHWHGGRILCDLEKINPDFYPKPIKEKKSTNKGVTSDLEELKDEFLTKEDFIKVYEKCGKILHAENPFGSKIDYSWYEKSNVRPRWGRIGLLRFFFPQLHWGLSLFNSFGVKNRN